MQIANETILSVNLSHLHHNFNYLKSKLKSKTKIIAVVKAFAYGHGDLEISKKLEKIGVYAFWVSDFEEGVFLRKYGIKIKIIVANPGMKSSDVIKKYNLDVVIYNKQLLDLYCSINTKTNIHIKINSGMNRYGFDNDSLKYVLKKLSSNSNLNISSICSHLASSEKNVNYDFTISQIKKFTSIAKSFEKKLNKKLIKHILNTNGVINHTKYQMNAVRIGIGLYGSANDNNLIPISKLNSVIVQTHNINKGDCVGYDCKFIAKKNMTISIIPIGYADGLNRKLGNGVGEVVVNNKLCQIIGEISMDSFMINTTNMSIKVGDHVEVFGENNFVTTIAKKINTIPYEIYATLNRRLKRIYYHS